MTALLARFNIKFAQFQNALASERGDWTGPTQGFWLACLVVLACVALVLYLAFNYRIDEK